MITPTEEVSGWVVATFVAPIAALLLVAAVLIP